MYKYVSNVNYLKDMIDLFIADVSSKQKGLKVSFNNGYLEKSEGYKLQIIADSRRILDLGNWSLNNSNKINEEVIQVLKHKENNIVNYHTITHALNIINEQPERTAKIFYNLFTTNNDSDTFELMGELFGYRTDLLSYFMFVKEPNRYVPCKSTLFKDKMDYLGIDHEMLSGARITFDKYMQFNHAIEEVASIYSDYIEQINLIDAHSFVWLAEILHKDKNEPVFDKNKVIEKDTLRNVKTRNNQSKFRESLIQKYNGRCCVTGCKVTELLLASHIKPWRNCINDNEWLNPNNGLLLIPNLDSVFDKGYITFDSDGSIIISNLLDEDDLKCLGINHEMRLIQKPNQETKLFLEYHRKNVFIG